MIYDILQYTDPRLRAVSEPVDLTDLATLQQFIDDLDATRRDARGVGIAAPQVGVLKRIISIEIPAGDRPTHGDVPETPLTIVVNPVLAWQSEREHRGLEGCLSIRGFEGYVARPAEVRVEGFTRTGEPVIYQADSLFARALLHEIDHLNGILYFDHLAAHRDLRRVSPVDESDPIWTYRQSRIEFTKI